MEPSCFLSFKQETLEIIQPPRLVGASGLGLEGWPTRTPSANTPQGLAGCCRSPGWFE